MILVRLSNRLAMILVMTQAKTQMENN